MIDKRVRIKPGYGYFDTTDMSYGGCFRRAGDDCFGVVVAEFMHKGRQARIKLESGRVAVARVEHIEEAS